MSVQVSYKKQTVFFLILIILTLVLVEGLVRNLNAVSTPCYFIENELFSDYDYFTKKDMCFEYITIEYDFTSPIRLLEPNQNGDYININSDGFRGKEFDFKTNNYKIFLLGGSTIFGHVSSSDETTIPGFLQQKFNDDGINVDVINAGIPSGYSRTELYYLENHILKYSPDLIILYDGANDGTQPIRNISYDEFNENEFFVNEGLEKSPKSKKTTLSTLLTKYEYHTGLGLAQFISKSIEKPTMINTNYDKVTDFSLKSIRLANNWEKICSVALENNFKSINIIQPVIGTSDRILSNSEKNITAQVNSEFLKTISLNKSQIQHCQTVLDLTNSFEGMDDVTIYFDATHMTDFGNEIVANKIYEQIYPIVLEEFLKK